MGMAERRGVRNDDLARGSKQSSNGLAGLVEMHQDATTRPCEEPQESRPDERSVTVVRSHVVNSPNESPATPGEP